MVVGILILKQKNKKQEESIKPQPVDIAFSQGHEEGEWRDKLNWIESMHKCDSTINWRSVNYEVRLAKTKFRKENYQTKNEAISIADGLLVGNWRETGSNNLAGRTHLIEIDQEVDSIYCASSGGNIWKADKNGNGWHVLNDNFKINDIRMLREIPNGEHDRLLVASGGWGIPGFYYSDDDGATWTASTGLSSIADWGYVKKAMVANDDSNTIYLLAMEWHNANWEKQTTLYISTNQGGSFTKKLSFVESEHGAEGNFDIWCDPQDDICYFAKSDKVYYINETFDTVLISQYNQESSGNILISGCKTNTETNVYTAVYNDNHTDFYFSSDAGANWEQKGSIESGPFMQNSFCVSQLEPEKLYYGGVECYRSSNNGENWAMLNEWGEYYADIENKLHADIPGINSFVDNENNEFVYINTDGGTYISHDQLATVQNISMNNLNIGQFYSVYSHRNNSNYIFAGSQDQGYQICDNNNDTGTANFTQILSGDYGHLVSSNGGNSVWMVYPGYAMYYPQATSNPYYSEWWEFDINGQFWIPPLMPHPTNPNICYLGGGTTGSGTHILEILSNSGSLISNELAYDFSGNTSASAISAIAFSPLNTDYRYVMNGNGEFFISTDGGFNWEMTNGFNGPDGNYLYGAAVVPSNTILGKVYVAGSGYSNPPVFVTDNNGENFTSISNGMPSTMVYEISVTPNDEFIFAATDAGPYVFVAETNQWYDLAQNSAPDQTYWTVDYDPQTETARFGTYGRGIWDFKISSGLNINNNSEMDILSVYPNPAISTITISGVNNTERVHIYNMFGNVIIDTNLKNINISTLSNGTYFITCAGETVNFIKI
jgi:hypothetical protein